MPKDNTIVALNEEHNEFILPEEDLHPNLFGFHSVQVDATEKCLIYRDGRLFKQLGPGPYRWWNGFRHKWKKQRINMRVEMLSFDVVGRVKGPQMEEGDGTAPFDLACEVTADLDLVCKLADIETFLQFRNPLSVFSSSFKNMVVELIGDLPYDQYGKWATHLRDQIYDRLTLPGRDNAERRIGVRVEDVFVRDFRPNTAHDRNMMANYQSLERLRRELAETQAKTKRDTVIASSLREQGDLLNIAPSILALKDSPVMLELIKHDAELRKLATSVGLTSGVNILPIQDSGSMLGSGQGSTVGYLNPPQPHTPDPSQSTISGSLPPQPGTSFNTNTNPNNLAFSSGSGVNSGPLAGQGGGPVDAARQARELAELRQQGFQTAGDGKVTPIFDARGNMVEREWVLQAAIQRPNGDVLSVIFHCPNNFPTVAPTVQVRSPNGGLSWMEPNTLKSWHIGRLLVEIAQEINNDLP